MKKEDEYIEIKKIMERGIIRLMEQEIQGDWAKIDNSEYCRYYKLYKKT